MSRLDLLRATAARGLAALAAEVAPPERVGLGDLRALREDLADVRQKVATYKVETERFASLDSLETVYQANIKVSDRISALEKRVNALAGAEGGSRVAK